MTYIFLSQYGINVYNIHLTIDVLINFAEFFDLKIFASNVIGQQKCKGIKWVLIVLD